MLSLVGGGPGGYSVWRRAMRTAAAVFSDAQLHMEA